jgi:hypothetical protein
MMGRVIRLQILVIRVYNLFVQKIKFSIYASFKFLHSKLIPLYKIFTQSITLANKAINKFG